MRGGGEAFSPQTSTHIQPPHHRRHCCRCPHCFQADLENPNQLPDTCAAPDLPVREAQNSPMGDLNPQSHARSAPAFFFFSLFFFFFASNLREMRSGQVATAAGRDQIVPSFLRPKWETIIQSGATRHVSPIYTQPASLWLGSVVPAPPRLPPRLDHTTAHPEGRGTSQSRAWIFTI